MKRLLKKCYFYPLFVIARAEPCSEAKLYYRAEPEAILLFYHEIASSA